MNTIYHSERDMCYLVSIIYINQIVLDMEKYQFEAFSSIPDEILRTYSTLKTILSWGMVYNKSC